MVERRGGAGFLHEPAAAVLVGQAISRQNLDRDIAAEPRGASAVHLAHPSRAQRRQDLVRAETRAARKSQWIQVLRSGPIIPTH